MYKVFPYKIAFFIFIYTNNIPVSTIFRISFLMFARNCLLHFHVYILVIVKRGNYFSNKRFKCVVSWLWVPGISLVIFWLKPLTFVRFLISVCSWIFAMCHHFVFCPKYSDESVVIIKEIKVSQHSTGYSPDITPNSWRHENNFSSHTYIIRKMDLLPPAR